MKIKLLYTLFLIFISFNSLFSQTYVGAGFAGGIIDTEFLSHKEARGASFSVLREIKLGEGRWRMDPTLNMAFLFNKMDRNIDAFYTTMVSLTPNVAYEIVQKNRLTVAPFVGPYANWVITKGGDRNYYDQDNNQFVYESYFTNEVRFGFEFGLAANILIKDNFSIKIIPFDFQLTRSEGDSYNPNGYTYPLKITSSILISL